MGGAEGGDEEGEEETGFHEERGGGAMPGNRPEVFVALIVWF
jgi:hypothetical protein